jgi:hypothetical protein
MLSPVHGSLCRVQAEFPLIQVVQISRASSDISREESCARRVVKGAKTILELGDRADVGSSGAEKKLKNSAA